MSQVDKLVYISLLFWFVISFVFIYFIIYSYFLPLFFSISKVRSLFFFFFIHNNKVRLIFMHLFNFTYIAFLKNYLYSIMLSLVSIYIVNIQKITVHA